MVKWIFGLHGALVVLLLGLAAPASASPNPVLRIDESGSTVTCDNVVGAVTWSPNLTSRPESGASIAKVDLTLGECTSSNAIPIAQGKIRGTLGSTSDLSCMSLLTSSAASWAGNLRVKWRTGGPDRIRLTSGITLITAKTTTVGVQPNGDDYLVDPNGMPDSSTGSFSGSDHGAGDSFMVDVGSSSVIAESCAASRGVKKLTVYSGVARFG
jgi:hypothetical protein